MQPHPLAKSFSTSGPDRARIPKKAGKKPSTADVTGAEMVCEWSDKFRLTNWALYLVPQTFWIYPGSDKPQSEPTRKHSG